MTEGFATVGHTFGTNHNTWKGWDLLFNTGNNIFCLILTEFNFFLNPYENSNLILEKGKKHS